MNIVLDIFENKKLIDDVPQEPGVYVIRSIENEILYVGKAKRLKNRIKTYLDSNKLDLFKFSMINEAKSVELIVVGSELEALLLESNLIKEYRPPYNVVLRDDKSYPYLRISLSEKYPRLFISRRIKNKKDFYFGPVTPADKLKKLIKLLKASYRIAQKNDKSCQTANAPCIYYQMGRCSAPCVGYIKRYDYMKMIDEIKKLLSKPAPLKRELKLKLKESVENEEFEKAIEIREKLKAIEILENKQRVSETKGSFCDVVVFEQKDIAVCAYIINIRFSNIVGNRSYFFYDSTVNDEIKSSFIVQYYSSGQVIPDVILVDGLEDVKTVSDAIAKFGRKPHIVVPKKGKKKALVELAKKNAKMAVIMHTKNMQTNLEIFNKIRTIFGFEKTPHIIDIVDISHLSFENVVGGVVRYSINGFEKEMYRRYSLSEKFESQTMEETLLRHKQLLLRERKKLPDMILVDGGTVQVNAASKVFKNYGVVGIAKQKIEGIANRDKGDVKDSIYFKKGIINVDNDVLMFFQKLRDEAHRFAVSYHRLKRKSSTLSSIMDGTKFIGQKRKKALFEKFGSIENIKNASVDDIASIKGITRKMALTLKEKLNAF